MNEGNGLMTVLVAYASKYGGTRGIAERIADVLNASDIDAVSRSVASTGELGEYEAFVLGSATYIGSWMKEAMSFTRQNRVVLASRPIWLFSSGPLGTGATNPQGQDVREAAVPKQLAELRDLLGACDHRVFFGVSDHTHFDLRDRLIYAVPGGKKLLADGDFRDWGDVEAWAKEIALALKHVPAESGLALHR
jgi:menaquinone-dependent protoporphyrinogen oxidase